MSANDAALQEEYSRQIGYVSAAHKYMNRAKVPDIRPWHKRVKMMAIMLESKQLEVERLTVLLQSADD